MPTILERHQGAWTRIKNAHSSLGTKQRGHPLLVYAELSLEEKNNQREDKDLVTRLRKEMVQKFWRSSQSPKEHPVGFVAVTVMENYAADLEAAALEPAEQTPFKPLVGNAGLRVFRNLFALPPQYLAALGS